MVERKEIDRFSLSSEQVMELAKLAGVETEGKSKRQIEKEIISISKAIQATYQPEPSRRPILYPRDMHPLREAQLRLIVRKVIEEDILKDEDITGTK